MSDLHHHHQPPTLDTSGNNRQGGSFFANNSLHTPLTPDYDDVESPSLTRGNALARFEFENLPAGDSRNGTKVLMVEWEDDQHTKLLPGHWTVSWEGKKTAVLDANAADGSREGLHRLYFLLSAAERIPGTVSLTLQSKDQQHALWRTHPLPAIFPPELGASARQAGKKGVLHTVWAKKRLEVLKQEIQHEETHNPEGVALSMAMQERDWIESNFGVRTKPHDLDTSTISTTTTTTTSSSDTTSLGLLPSPTSPRSPGRGPLLEKLKGLRLDTEASSSTSQRQGPNPLSPEGSDVAVNFNTFAALHGLGDLNTLSAKPPQNPPQEPPQWRIAPQSPPESILAQQRNSSMASLNALAVNDPATYPSPAQSLLKRNNSVPGDEDDLFALPLSPRSPADQHHQQQTAFSFGAADTAKYLQ
jgi:hypothetical protein